MKRFDGRLALVQRVLPSYRAPFFDLLAQACERMSLFAGLPRADEGIVCANKLDFADFTLGRNIHLFKGSYYLCYQLGLLDWLEKSDPVVLIVEANPRYLATSFAAQWMHRQKKSVIGWGLGSPRPIGPLAGFRQTRRVNFLSQFDALISYSQRGADEYAALGFPREKIFVAYNAVSPAPKTKPEDRPQTIAGATILFVGRLQARKRVDSLLRACAELDQKIRLIIVGDGPERQNLESLAREVYPSTEFIGAKHGIDVKPYFAAADLFVLPGTGGLAVQEAMGYGLPVIVAKGDGTQDDLVRAGNGWQIAPEDYAALLSAMKEALSHVPRLRRMGNESYRIVSEEINLEKMVEAFVRALQSVR